MKNILFALLVAGMLALMWYLFIKPFEYEVNMKANTLPGDIIETIRIWNKSLEGAEIAEVDSLNSLKQHITYHGNSYVYVWNFVLKNDSATHINIEISQPGKELINKLLIPFTNQSIEKDAREIANSFYEILQEHLQITNVKIVGESEIPHTFCVCRSLKTKQTDKAYGMMRDYDLITSFITHYSLKPNGEPIVKINKWNHESGEIEFDFCFPIVKQDSLPIAKGITYKEFKKTKALKAIYHGNYITSDRAWYSLLNYAISNDYKFENLPEEHFYNNPNLGASEEEWKAEIYLPIK